MTREEAIKNLQKVLGFSPTYDEAFYTLFPEFKEESEEEKIRKRIRLCLAECVHKDIIRDYEHDEAVAWLEKQKEQKPIKRPKFKIGDVVKFKGFGDEPADDTPLKIVGYDNELYLFDNGTTDLFSEQDLYELVEQKPAEWSEEDEKMMKDIDLALRKLYDASTRLRIETRLKSLRPQYHGDVTMTEAYKMGLEAGKASSWKPSEEQIKEYSYWYRNFIESGLASPSSKAVTVLGELLEQLKKL